MINERISNELNKLSEERQVHILYACESGSRAWGFPSPDSDYDVRFIYAHNLDWYLSIFEQRDVIEKPITDELDLGGWDLKKAFGLMFKANAPLLEWLHSPIVYYQNDTVLEKLQQLSEKSFCARHVCYHYYVMADKMWQTLKTQPNIKLKTMFYIMRALLCCEWIIKENTPPPVEMLRILDRFYRETEFYNIVQDFIQIKSGLNEAELLARDDYGEQFAIVENRFSELLGMMPQAFPQDSPQLDKKEMDQVFINILRQFSFE